MVEIIVELINKISNNNPVISGAISLWGLGVMSYLLRNLPKQLGVVVGRQATTEVTLTSQNKSFHYIMKWMERKGYSGKIRRVKLSNGKWGDSRALIKTIGYGNHVILYKGRPLWVNLSRENTMDAYDKETLTILKLGRSHTLLDELIEEAVRGKGGMTEMFYSYHGSWRVAEEETPVRRFGSIILKKGVEEEIIGALDRFKESENWYLERGIPYTLNFLLYGPNGTGKTSIIKAIASYTGKDIYTLSTKDLMEDAGMIRDVGKDGITVVEDVHGCSGFVGESENKITIDAGGRKEGISEILNAMDGLVSGHGRILVMTTNYIEKIEESLMRPGRCDYKIEIGYFDDNEMFERFMWLFFPNVDRGLIKSMLATRVPVDNLTGAILQDSVKRGMEWNQVIKKYTREV